MFVLGMKAKTFLLSLFFWPQAIRFCALTKQEKNNNKIKSNFAAYLVVYLAMAWFTFV